MATDTFDSEILDPVAETIASFITDLDITDRVVTGYKWQRAMWDAKLPVGEVGVPTIRRTEPGEAESQMGSDDWYLEYPIGLYVELAESVSAQALAVGIVEKFIRAVDANPSLGDPTIHHASVIEAEPEVLAEKPRALLIYRCRLVFTKLAESAS